MTDPLRLRVLIADDERPARAKVRRFLANDADVGAIHEAWDGPTALAVIRDESPDLVLLDIQMPGMSGLELLASLPQEAAPHVVFITAFDAFAVQAFELAAVDYLLKPFDADRFSRAMRRAKDAVTAGRREEEMRRLRRAVAELGGTATAPLERLVVERSEGTDERQMLQLADVDRIEAERNYVRVHAGPASWRVRVTLAELEERLDPALFARVGRGTILNVARIARLEPAGHGDYTVVLRSGGRARLSRRYVDRLQGRISSRGQSR